MSRSRLLSLLFVVLGSACSAQDAACLACHGTSKAKAGAKGAPSVDAAKFEASVHGGVGCSGCHGDLDPKNHPGKGKPQPVACANCHDAATATFNTSVHGLARKGGNAGAPGCAECHGTHEVQPLRSATSPVNRNNLAATCGMCHDQVVKDVQESVHGKAMARGLQEAPSCTDCHSDHDIRGLKTYSPLRISEQICSRCHASQRMNRKLHLPANRVSTFFESYHGMAASMGSTQAANCASCHGFHNILPSSDPKSSVHQDNLGKTCAKCHPDAGANFIKGKIHLDGQDRSDTGSRVNWWVRQSYLAMIYLTIGGMLFHNFLILRRKAIMALRSFGRTVLRMNLVARIQHALLALSFIYLVISGFALKYPESWLGFLVGSSEVVRRIGHRSAAVVMMGLSVYHLYFILFTRDGRQFVKDMLPIRKDITDLLDHVRYLLRPGSPRPAFGRFGYPEKAEYWAVIWGTVVMGGTGLTIWFKLWATQFAPRWVVDVANTIHFYEAILATLSILVWHFFFVMFDPDIYPINWAFWDGRVDREHHEHERPLDTSTRESEKE